MLVLIFLIALFGRMLELLFTSLFFLVLFFIILDLCYYWTLNEKAHVMIKYFYYVLFVLSLTFSIYFSQHIWGYHVTVLTFSAIVLFIFLVPFLAFKLLFAIISLFALLYLCQSIIVGFQSIQYLLSLILLMIAIYAFLRFSVLNVDGVVLKIKTLFKDLNYNVGDLDLLFGLRSFSSKFILLYGYLKDVCKLGTVLTSAIESGLLSSLLAISVAITKKNVYKEIKEFMASHPPQIADIRNIIAHGASIKKYRGIRLEAWDAHKQIVIKRIARYLYGAYLIEIYPLYLELFWKIQEVLLEHLKKK